MTGLLEAAATEIIRLTAEVDRLNTPTAYGPPGEMCEEDLHELADNVDAWPGRPDGPPGRVGGPLYGIRYFGGPYWIAQVPIDDEDFEPRIFTSKEAALAAIYTPTGPEPKGE
jgi:hypothetical protein